MITALAMIAFAANSLLCRGALAPGAIDPALFTLVRLASGAAALALLVRLRRGAAGARGDWGSALALFAYAAGFSFAYVRLSAATGALLLFGAVQATMIAAGVAAGDRPGARAVTGFAVALAGLGVLLGPGATRPAPGAAALMLAAGVAWGVYSLRGRGTADPLAQTGGNFLRAVPAGLALALAWPGAVAPRPSGIALAVASGALASGVGYALWYTALRRLTATRAAIVQLSVPVIAALGGVVLLAEPLTPRLVGGAAAVLGGIALARGAPSPGR